MRCVLLLRGINVGGKNKVPMASLKQVLSDAGFTEVSTLLQSGNVVLESPDSEEETLSVARKAFTERFGFSCGILLRDSDQISALLAEKPFSMEEIERAEAADPAVEHRYVYFLPCMPDRTRPAALPERAGNSPAVRTEHPIVQNCGKADRRLPGRHGTQLEHRRENR